MNEVMQIDLQSISIPKQYSTKREICGAYRKAFSYVLPLLKEEKKKHN